VIRRLIEKRINSLVEKVLSQRKDEINTRIETELETYENEKKILIVNKQEENDRIVLEKEQLIKNANEEKQALLKELSVRKDEIDSYIKNQLDIYESDKKKIISDNRVILDKLISEKESLIRKVEAEKSKLSETLNIVNQNLTAQDIWLKLWQLAFDKAMDVCWDLTKETTKKTIDVVKNKAVREANEKTQEIIETNNLNIENKLKDMDLNKMSVLNARNESHKNYLIYNRNGDKKREQYYLGQLDLIERILNEKNNSS